MIFSYEMSTLLSSKETMCKNIIKQHQQAVQPYLEKYADPNIEFNSIVLCFDNEAEAITNAVAEHNYDLVIKYTQEKESLSALILPQDWQLLRKCPAPIMVVRDGNWKHQRRILVAVNVSNNQEEYTSLNNELVSLELI